MPRRSTGCEKCRQRKVRCDEVRPHCQRCTDYGVVCPGYRPPAEKDLHFVDQTRHVTRKSGHEPAASVSNTSQQITQNTQYRFRNQFSGKIVESGPTVLGSRHLHRVQLLSTFLDLYLPKRRDPKKNSHFAYIAALPNLDLSSPLLQVVVDTLCLAELGSLYDDERCLHESRSRYVRALPMLAKELVKPPARQLPKDTILATITLLSMCELFDAIARSDLSGQGWISHVQGAQQLLQANGPEVVNSPFVWLLFHNIRHSSLCMGLVKRKAIFFEEPKWLGLTAAMSTTDPFIGLYDLVVQAPGLLERADNLTYSTCFEEDFRAICKALTCLRTKLDEWQAHHYNERPYEIMDIQEMAEFNKLCPNRFFDTAYSFRDVQVCSQMQLHWVICLMLDFTIANIYRVYGKKHPLPDTLTFTTRTKQDHWKDMYECATDYCRTIPYCCEPDTASAGRIGTFLLRIAQSFFEISGYSKELKWCLDIRKMFEQSTVRPPASAPPRPGSSKEPKASFKVLCQSPKAPLMVEGKYPNRGYAPRRPREHVKNDEDEYANRRPPVNCIWPPSFGALPQADLLGTLVSPDMSRSNSSTTSASPRPDSDGMCPVDDASCCLPDGDANSTDPLLNPPQVLGLPSNRLRRDLDTPPVYGRRWNVPPEIAGQASRALYGVQHEISASQPSSTLGFGQADMRQVFVTGGLGSWFDDVNPTADEEARQYEPMWHDTAAAQDFAADPDHQTWRTTDPMGGGNVPMAQANDFQNPHQFQTSMLGIPAQLDTLDNEVCDGMGQLAEDGKQEDDTASTTAAALRTDRDPFINFDELAELSLMPHGNARKGPIGAMCL